MNSSHITLIAAELRLNAKQVEAATALLADGATVPFIARYRKEATGSLDEVAITAIRDRLKQLEALDQRREAILASLLERSLLTDKLKQQLAAADSMALLEDIYLPFKPKRRTRAALARERGLEPLAQRIFSFQSGNPENDAAAFVNAEKGVESRDDALAGARDIIAEWINEEPQSRASMRELWSRKSLFHSKAVRGKETEGAKYKDYFDWNEAVHAAPSHRILALLRGEAEGFLSVQVAPPPEEALSRLESRFIPRSQAGNRAAPQVKLALQEGYKRLLAPAMETETRNAMKLRADTEAIRVFAENVRQLLLAPPLGRKNMLAIDPGFRTGCKVVCLDKQGKLLHNDVVYPHQSDTQAAAQKIKSLCEKHAIESIAIGNGTAGRETEAFIRQIDFGRTIPVVSVNESGASIYSASEVAREEFPDHDLTVRGAVSIGRRLMDPLAELVKIDPKSIGVGQYQHDVDPGALKNSLDDVVMSCVNSVGVEVNTASKKLLSYVSGLSPQLASNIVQFRNQNGAFASREQLRKVPRLGPKAYEQAAGFLRIRDARNVLDGSAVHPESYHIVEKMAQSLSCSVTDLVREESLRKRVELTKYVSATIGLPTLNDIMSELSKPGRDPRAQFEHVQFADGVNKMDDLKPGMRLQGVVTNVTAFGAFVDVGVHQDGLVHISQLADRFVKNPGDIVKVRQKVQVTVVSIDLERKRIALSMKSAGKC